MSGMDLETKRKLREMGAVELLQAMESQDEALSMSLAFNEWIRMAVDEAHSAYTTNRVGGLIRRAKLCYPDADLRTLDFVEECGLDQHLLASLGRCSFIAQNHNVVFQGFTGSRKSYLGCALAKQACRHQIRSFYVRMPDLEGEWVQAQEQRLGASKFLKKYGSYTLLVIDEWLLDRPDGDFLRVLLELMERCFGSSSTVFCTQYLKKDWHQRLGSGVHADAIMDRIIHDTTWFETGTYNMREQLSLSYSEKLLGAGGSLGRVHWLPTAIFLVPEGNIGWYPDLRIFMSMLPWLTGAPDAQYWLLLARPVFRE